MSEGEPLHDARMVPLAIESGGDVMNGLVYVPPGSGPHPAVLMLHGLPGFERNFDLAQAYRRAGWAVMCFHYRGAWGSGGTFSFEHVLEDAAAALAYLRSDSLAQLCGIDREAVAVVGHSMGGWVALMLGAEQSVLGVTSIAGWNVGAAAALARDDPGALTALIEVFEPEMGPLSGVDCRELFASAVAGADRLDVRTRASALVGTPLLLVIATNDPVVPRAVHHDPLVASLMEAGARPIDEQVLETDHAFSDHRLELTRITEQWLGRIREIGPSISR
jgi:pimeloyl-ACP methyl ester carboxylesterase